MVILANLYLLAPPPSMGIQALLEERLALFPYFSRRIWVKIFS